MAQKVCMPKPEYLRDESPFVHTIETKPPADPPYSYAEYLREAYPNEWPATYAAYEEWDAAHDTHRSSDLRNCRSFAWFKRSKITGKVRVHGSACHLRWCPLCAEAHAAFLGESVREWYNHALHPKLLTLTLKSADLPLADEINRLYINFNRLRNQAWFSSRIAGGIWFFQVTSNETTYQWHPHLHVLLDGEFLPHSELQARWLKLTGDSDIVDIRGCWSPQSASNHVARYATRPGALASVPDLLTQELLAALEGRRICGSWGSARSVRLHRPAAPDGGDWETLGSWQEVTQAVHTCPEARAIYLAWKCDIALGPGITMIRPEPELFELAPPELSAADKYYNVSLYDP